MQKKVVEGLDQNFRCGSEPTKSEMNGFLRYSASPEYYNFLVKYYADFRALLASLNIPGEAIAVLSQCMGDADTLGDGVNGWNVKRDQLRFCQEGHGILSGPEYPFKIWDNNVHPDGENTVEFADVYSRAIASHEAGLGWPTLGPIGWRIVGNDVVIRLDKMPTEELQIDASNKYNGVAITNHGVEGVGAAVSGISVYGDELIVRCSGTPTRIKYASQVQNVTGFNDGYGACRGELRSSYTWINPISGNRQYRWVPSFEIDL